MGVAFEQGQGSGAKYAVIEVPDFALQAVLRLYPEARLASNSQFSTANILCSTPQDFSPAVLLSEEGKEAVVTELTGTARRAGVRPGMSPSQAIARCPRILLLYRRQGDEAAARRALLDCVFTLSPSVEETAAGVYTVDLRGRQSSQSDFEKVFGLVARLGLKGRIGVAASPLLARYAARVADPVLVAEKADFLKNLPLKLAGPSAGAAEILEEWGVRTLGQLTALPRQEVALRLGHDGAALWDRAAGRGERPLRTVSLPVEFVERCELEHGIESLEPLLFLLRRIIDQLCLRLEAAGKAAGEVVLELGMEDWAESYRRVFRVPEPTAESEVVFRMLHAHLEKVRTEAAITEVGVAFKPVSSLVRQRELLGNGLKDSRRFAETLAQVSAIAGDNRTGSPFLENTHRPDSFYMKQLNTDPKWLDAEQPPVPSTGPVLRRFRPPLPASVECRQRKPFWFRSERVSGRIIACRGPWKESGGWWEAGQRWEREEWDVEVSGGGLYRLVQERKCWVLEGVYD